MQSNFQTNDYFHSDVSFIKAIKDIINYPF